MNDYIKKHYQFAFMLVLWVVTGIYASPLHLAVIPLCIILLKRRNMYVELICGFIFVLVLSDSWSPYMKWASNVKDIYLLMLSLLVIFNQKEFAIKNKLFFPFIPYFTLAAILILRSPDPLICFQRTLSYVLVFTILPFYYLKLIAEEPERFIKGLVYTATMLLLYGFLLIFINFDAAYLVGRYRGVMGNPNGLGIFCTVLFAFFIIVTGKYKSLFPKWEMGLIFGCILLSVLLAGSRNSLISMIIFFAFSRFFKVSYWLGFTVIIVIGITYQLVMNNLPAIITSLGLQEYMRVEHLEDGSGRIVAWIFGWEKIQENFWFGRGFHYEGMLYEEYKQLLYNLGHIGNSHNSYLATWLNTGIIGLILFLFALIYTFVKASVKSPYALPLMYCVLFSATFEAWLIGSLNPHTPMMLLMWVIMMADVNENVPVEKEITTDRFKIPETAM